MAELATIDPKEVAFFNKISGLWWEDETLTILRNMNQLRVPLIRDRLTEVNLINKQKVDESMPLQGLHILDVGCGGGLLSEELAKLGCTVVGIDISLELVEEAKRHAALNPSLANLSYFYETVEEHAKSNFEKYDAVVASEVLDHVGEPEAFLKECIKCLKPGGSIFVSTINRTLASWLFAIVLAEYVFKFIPEGTHSWAKFVRPCETVGMLEKHGCKKRSVRGMLYNLFNYTWQWSWIQSTWYIVHATKSNKI